MAGFLKGFAKRGLRKVAAAMGLQEMASEIKVAAAMGLQEMASEIRKLRAICISIQHQTAVAPDGLPIPPPEFHCLVSGNDTLDLSEFFRVGRGCAESITGLLKKRGLDINSLQSILDFGCGCGRVTRYFHTLKHAKVYGTDYNPTLIDWCRRNLPFAEFEVNTLYPPLGYSEGKFDLIYAFSVFTHLSESLQMSWVAELSRVLKPGGYLLITTHGAAYAELVPPYAREQFRAGQLVVQNENSSGENECAAFHPVRYVTDTLAKGFEVLDFVPGEGANDSRGGIAQDIFFLRKPNPNPEIICAANDLPAEGSAR